MRKLLTVMTLAFSFLAATANAEKVGPPMCGDNCPWVQVGPPMCGDNCPWEKVGPPMCGDNCPWQS
jgi:hypothetical protein